MVCYFFVVIQKGINPIHSVFGGKLTPFGLLAMNRKEDEEKESN